MSSVLSPRISIVSKYNSPPQVAQCVPLIVVDEWLDEWMHGCMDGWMDDMQQLHLDLYVLHVPLGFKYNVFAHARMCRSGITIISNIIEAQY